MTGFKELTAKLRKLDASVQNKVMRKALRAGAKPILVRAKANAPVSDASENSGLKSLSDNTSAFGALFGATEKQIAKAQKRAVKQAVGVMKKQGQRYPGQLRDSLKIRAIKRNRAGVIGVVVQSRKGDFRGDEYYAAFQEYGTSKMPGKGFIRAAFDAESKHSIDIIAGVCSAEIDKLAAGASVSG
jgi:HK97 gp10 family phage protein